MAKANHLEKGPPGSFEDVKICEDMWRACWAWVKIGYIADVWRSHMDQTDSFGPFSFFPRKSVKICHLLSYGHDSIAAIVWFPIWGGQVIKTRRGRNLRQWVPWPSLGVEFFKSTIFIFMILQFFFFGYQLTRKKGNTLNGPEFVG